MNKKITVGRIMYFLVSASFIFSLIWVPMRAYFDEAYRENTEYRIMIFQSLFGLLTVNLPSFLERRFTWRIPTVFSVLFMLFLWGAIFAGEVWEFYYKIPLWDDILHLTSSMMAAILGFSLIDILNNRQRGYISLSPLFVCLFSVTFAVFIGVLWEIYEFTFDGILGLNMQKFAKEGKSEDVLSLLVGRDALVDTMEDLIIDTVGAVSASLIGYVSLKLNKGWIEAFKVVTPSINKEQEQTQNKNDS